eukprot:m.17052 g.17052  ORF g.17052 m.17052 type:complete len:2013 (+) comp27284_c1_seq1:143-6181(+)
MADGGLTKSAGSLPSDVQRMLHSRSSKDLQVPPLQTRHGPPPPPTVAVSGSPPPPPSSSAAAHSPDAVVRSPQVIQLLHPPDAVNMPVSTGPRSHRGSLSPQPELMSGTANHHMTGETPQIVGAMDEMEEYPSATVCTVPGRCQANGELRLCRLHSHGQRIDLPDGFALVGMRSPQLGSVMILAVVDKRYLPDDQTGFSLQGFSGNCVGCGRQGFRYFTEFCHHCNMKLTTQPKKQKHIRFYINCSQQGALTRGEPILWRAESRRRTSATPATNLSHLSAIYQQHQLRSSPSRSPPRGDGDTGGNEMETGGGEYENDMGAGPSKKVKLEPDDNDGQSSQNLAPTSVSFVTGKPPPSKHNELQAYPLTTNQRSRSSDHLRHQSLKAESKQPKRVSLAGPLVSLEGLPDEIQRQRQLSMLGRSTSPRNMDVDDLPPRTMRSQSLIVTSHNSLSGSSGSSSKMAHPLATSFRNASSSLSPVMASSPLHSQRRLPAKPVLLSCQEGLLKFPSSISPHIIVSNLLQGCFCLSKAESRDFSGGDDDGGSGAAGTGAASLVSLPSEALALLIVNYFSSLPESDLVQREYVEAMIYSARHGEAAWAKQHLKQKHSMLLTHTQLPFLARLTAYASQGRVLVITAPSIGEGVEAAFTKLDSVQHLPDFVIILQASKYWSIEVGVLVVNPVQSRALAEGIAQDAGVDPETMGQGPIRERQFVSLIAYGIGSVPSAPSIIALDSFLKQFASGLASNANGDAFSPFSEDELDLVQEEDVPRMLERIKQHPKLFDHVATASVVHPAQEALATRLMSRIRAISEALPQHLDLSRFRHVELIVMVPLDQALFHQTVTRLQASQILVQLGLATEETNSFETAAKFVIKGRYHPEESAKFVKFVAKVRKNPNTLFLVVQDAAHLGLGKYNGEPANRVVIDTRLNCKDLLEAENVIALLVASMPYALQHCSSRVRPENEVHWMDEVESQSTVADGDKKASAYVGLTECLGAMNDSRQPQFVRQDDEFEDAVYRQCSDVHCYDLSESEIRTALLVRNYVAGMLAAVDPLRLPTEHSPSPLTAGLLADLIRRSDAWEDGLGCSVLIRVPFLRLAKFMHKRLTNARDMLGLKFRFDVILDDGMSELSVSDHYLKRMRHWRFAESEKDEADSWFPKCFSDLEGLPCILIFAGPNRIGNTFPRSLKYYDLRATTMPTCTRAELEQELGICYRYETATGSAIKLRSVQDGKCLHYYIPRSLYHLLHTPVNRVHEKRLLLCPDPQTTWISNVDRPPLMGHTVRSQSLYYRTWTQPKRTHYDFGRGPTCVASEELLRQAGSATIRESKEGFHPRRLLLSGPPQIGKTAVYFFLAKLLHSTLKSFQEVEVYNEVPLLELEPQRPSMTKGVFPPYPAIHSIPCDLSTGLVVMNIAVSPVAWERRSSSGSGSGSGPDDLIAEETEERRRDSEAARVLASLAQVGGPGLEFDASDEEVSDKRRGSAQSDVSRPSLNPSESKADGWGRLVRKTKLLTMAPTCSYDAFHRSEACRRYREAVPAMVPAARRSSSRGSSGSLSLLQYMLVDSSEAVPLYWYIPQSYETFFCINDGRQTISSLRLPFLPESGSPLPADDCLARTVRTPVFIPSTGRYEHGLLNLFYSMNQSTHLAVIVVKQCELTFYARCWPNHVIMALPSSADQMGVGAVRHWIKRFATQNLQVERDRWRAFDGLKGCVWPLVLMLDDSIVMWKCLASKDRKETVVSLCDVLTHVEQDPHVLSYGLIGFLQWHSSLCHSVSRVAFAHAQVSPGAVLLNLDRTLHIDYDPLSYGGEQLDFNIRCGLAGVIMCRYRHFAFVRKRIASGGATDFALPGSTGGSDPLIDVQRLACAPDAVSSTPVQAPAHYIMQKYLALASSSLFPVAVDSPEHPVVVPGRYVNLGPSITVFVMDFGGSNSTPTPPTPSLVFGGLLLYFADSRMTVDSLRNLKFVSGARLCLICRDRTALRQDVARLEVEDCWRLRLRDEFQTASPAGSPPLFFLTGTYCP